MKCEILVNNDKFKIPAMLLRNHIIDDDFPQEYIPYVIEDEEKVLFNYNSFFNCNQLFELDFDLKNRSEEYMLKIRDEYENDHLLLPRLNVDVDSDNDGETKFYKLLQSYTDMVIMN